MIGAYLEPSTHWQQAKDCFGDSPLTIVERVAQVEIFTEFIRGATMVLQSVEDEALGWGRLAPVLPELVEALDGSDLLLDATDETKKVLWNLLLVLLEPEVLRRHYTADQATCMLNVGLTIAASTPDSLRPDSCPWPSARRTLWRTRRRRRRGPTRRASSSSSASSRGSPPSRPSSRRRRRASGPSSSSGRCCRSWSAATSRASARSSRSRP